MCIKVRRRIKSTILIVHYFMNDCDFYECKVGTMQFTRDKY